MLSKCLTAIFASCFAVQAAAAAPGSWDWREKGAVTAVKDQGQCGSDWAFAATGAIEGLVAVKGGGLPDLSEQQLLDCSGSFGNHGCNGGLMSGAFDYVTASGIAAEASYPYTGRDGRCKQATAVARIAGRADVKRNDEQALMEAVARQPVVVAVDAMTWPSYKGGIFSGNCGGQLNHYVLVVGYTPDSWIVKNSWGTSWGEKGYIRLVRGKNICGIADQASYPTG